MNGRSTKHSNPQKEVRWAQLGAQCAHQAASRRAGYDCLAWGGDCQDRFRLVFTPALWLLRKRQNCYSSDHAEGQPLFCLGKFYHLTHRFAETITDRQRLSYSRMGESAWVLREALTQGFSEAKEAGLEPRMAG
jgi:hypothetical protein